MLHWAWLLFGFWSSLVMAHGLSSPPTRVLITAFEPFGGATENRTIAVAHEIQQARALLGNNVEVDVCVLPVAYDRAANIAISCFERISPRPSLVLSLGEGRTCGIQLETAARNLDDLPFIPDNQGVVRTRHEILPGAPDVIGFNFPAVSMYCSLPPAHRSQIRVSRDAGRYVCNNAAFRLANELARFSNTQYGFIHVPSHRCGPASTSKGSAELLAGMIKAALEYERARPARGWPLPHGENEARLPTNVSSISDILAILETFHPSDPCPREFLNRLRAEFPPDNY